MSDNNQIIDLVAKLSEKLAAETDVSKFDPSKPYALLPAGYAIHSLEKFAHSLEQSKDSPSRVKKNINFISVQSFLEYFTAFNAGNNPQIFHRTDDSGLQLMCVFDYDVPASIEGATEATWGEDKAFLKLSYSRDYKAWREKADKWFTQEEFALFVEENLHLFIKPAGAAMLEIAQHLKGTKNVTWQSGKNLRNGSTQFEYVEVLEAKNIPGGIDIPDYMELKMPMYEGFAVQDIKAVFRWKMGDNKQVQFGFRLLTKQAEQIAEDEVKKAVSDGTKLPLLAVANFEGITAR